MYYNHIEIIPSIIKSSRPSQFEGESFTTLEYVSKIAVKMNECVEEYNKFIDEVNREITSYKNDENYHRDMFERTMEQKFDDFKRIIDLKYKSQDLAISRAVEYMTTNIANSITEKIIEMKNSGELSDAILTALNEVNSNYENVVDDIASINANILEINGQITTINEEIDIIDGGTPT